MNYSESLEESEQQKPYILKLDFTLLAQAKVLGIPSDNIVEFIATIAQSMLRCPPNVRLMPHSNRGARVWSFRGFYPEQPLFIKVTISDIYNSDVGKNFLHVRARPLSVTVGSITHKWEKTLELDGNRINDYLTDKMENDLLGAKHDLQPLLSEKIHMPKCMSPKGMPIFRYKKPRKKNLNDED